MKLIQTKLSSYGENKSLVNPKKTWFWKTFVNLADQIKRKNKKKNEHLFLNICSLDAEDQRIQSFQLSLSQRIISCIKWGLCTYHILMKMLYSFRSNLPATSCADQKQRERMWRRGRQLKKGLFRVLRQMYISSITGAAFKAQQRTRVNLRLEKH